MVLEIILNKIHKYTIKNSYTGGYGAAKQRIGNQLHDAALHNNLQKKVSTNLYFFWGKNLNLAQR